MNQIDSHHWTQFIIFHFVQSVVSYRLSANTDSNVSSLIGFLFCFHFHSFSESSALYTIAKYNRTQNCKLQQSQFNQLAVANWIKLFLALSEIKLNVFFFGESRTTNGGPFLEVLNTPTGNVSIMLIPWVQKLFPCAECSTELPSRDVATSCCASATTYTDR